jgi:2-hydroxy-3-keto-5-methylthiopentenyl-1-phosphate phosphatase
MKKDTIVICDFDGTISVKDVNVEIFRAFGDDRNRILEEKYRNSEMGLRESLFTQYENIAIDQAVFERYVKENMELDINFFAFCDYADCNNIKIAIVSGGFINYIMILFDKYNRPLSIPIYSNKLGIVGDILLPQYGEVPECSKYYGPCGICKYKLIMQYKKDYRVIYVGDGYTDRCAAENADIVFAKDNLSKFCRENNIDYISYDTFSDIKEKLKDIILHETQG